MFFLKRVRQFPGLFLVDRVSQIGHETVDLRIIEPRKISVSISDPGGMPTGKTIATRRNFPTEHDGFELAIREASGHDLGPVFADPP